MIAIAAIVVFLSMAIEARRSARNETVQRARGGVEPPGDVYGVMRIAYPAAFLGMFGEAVLRQPSPAWWISGVLTFAASKALKWWAIGTLGRAWTFRVIVVPGDPLVADGPYRFLRHPNYVAVAGELVGTSIMTGAFVAGPIAVLGFSALMMRRIAIEERTLSETAGVQSRNEKG